MYITLVSTGVVHVWEREQGLDVVEVKIESCPVYASLKFETILSYGDALSWKFDFLQWRWSLPDDLCCPRRWNDGIWRPCWVTPKMAWGDLWVGRLQWKIGWFVLLFQPVHENLATVTRKSPSTLRNVKFWVNSEWILSCLFAWAPKGVIRLTHSLFWCNKIIKFSICDNFVYRFVTNYNTIFFYKRYLWMTYST